MHIKPRLSDLPLLIGVLLLILWRKLGDKVRKALLLLLVLLPTLASAEVQCGSKFWSSFEKFSKDEQLWNRMTDNPILTEYRGVVLSTSSKSLYSPSNCQRYEQGEPVPTLRNNELNITKNGELLAKTYWLGGVVITLKIQRQEGTNFVQILAGELHYDIWQRNGRPLEVGEILKKNILVYKLIWRGELP